MAESNTDNSGVPVNKPKSVQERIEANARARKTLRDRIGKAINNQSLDNTSQPTVTSQQLPSPNSNLKKKARTRNIFTKIFNVNAGKSSVNAGKRHVGQPKLTKNTKWLIVIVALTFCVVGSLTAIVISSIGRLNDEEIAEGGTYGDDNSCSSDGEDSCENGGECEQGNNSNEQGDLDDDNNDDDGANWSEEGVYGFDEYIRDIIASAESETDVIDDLGQLIDVSEGIEKADLLQERLAYILEMDVDKKYEDLAINDAKSIDEILESIDSARQVMNVAVYYGNQSIIAEYATILQVRKEASRDENDNDDEEIIG